MDIETWAFIGGPADGEKRKFSYPKPRVELLVPRALSITPEDMEPSDVVGRPNLGEYVWYTRVVFGAGPDTRFWFYLFDGLTYADAIEALFSRFSPPPADGWVVTSADGKRFRCWSAFGSDWTNDHDMATRYARRQDAEAVHAGDEDAWRIIPFERAGRYAALAGDS